LSNKQTILKKAFFPTALSKLCEKSNFASRISPFCTQLFSTLIFTFPHFPNLFKPQPADAANAEPRKQPKTNFSARAFHRVVLAQQNTLPLN
jgi:hypothetical protein